MEVKAPRIHPGSPYLFSPSLAFGDDSLRPGTHSSCKSLFDAMSYLAMTGRFLTHSKLELPRIAWLAVFLFATIAGRLNAQDPSTKSATSSAAAPKNAQQSAQPAAAQPPRPTGS